MIGSGYVGLVSAAGFAERGHNVVCVDVVKEKVDLINSKKSPIYEKGLEEILDGTLGVNLKASTDLPGAVLDSEVTFICVGTPSSDDGSVDLGYVKEVSKQIGETLKDKDNYHVVVVKSTVVPGTTEEVVLPLLEEYSGKKAGADFGVGMNPEFLREGVAVEDFLEPDRIALGAIDDKSMDVMEKVYEGFDAPLVKTSPKTAEMIKYASNSLLATKISFINEVGNICKKLGIDVYEVAEGVGLDHRISPKFLRAGPGFGGSCFPKDVKALVYKAKEAGEEPLLLESVLGVNAKQPLRVVDLARKKAGSLKGKRVAVIGLAFKADTDDMRDSPAIPIVNKLVEEGAKVLGYDPEAAGNAKQIFGDSIKYADSASQALDGADLALIVTEWSEFRDLDYSGMNSKVIIDARKMVDVNSLPDDAVYEGLCW